MMMSEHDATTIAEDLSESVIETVESIFNKVYDDYNWEVVRDELIEEFYMALLRVNW